MKTVISEADIADLVQSDAEMVRVLNIARDFNLPDWWIGAGFLRNKVWDTISGNSQTEMVDIDLVYFNESDTAPETDWLYDERLYKLDPKNIWEVRNQARMHYVNGFDPYKSTEDGIAHWTETATAVGVKLQGKKLRFLYCYGSDDLLNMIARPTPHLHGDLIQIFYDRVKKKNWQIRWPTLQIKA